MGPDREEALCRPSEPLQDENYVTCGDLGRIAHVEADRRIKSAAWCELDVGARRVDANHAATRARQGEGEAPCAAPNIQDSFPRVGPDEIDEQWREPSTPSPHEVLVGRRV
jgi:hypothetical protein